MEWLHKRSEYAKVTFSLDDKIIPRSSDIFPSEWVKSFRNFTHFSFFLKKKQ